MADDKPIIRFYTTGEEVDGDCACPDAVASPQVRLSGEPVLAEQDCACPGAAVPSSPPPLQAGQWRRRSEGHAERGAGRVRWAGRHRGPLALVDLHG